VSGSEIFEAGPSAPPAVVAVTGAAGYLGQRLLARLGQEDDVKRIVAIDIHPMPETGPKVTALRQDVTEPLEQAFRQHGVEAVVHFAFVLGQRRGRRVTRRVNVGGVASVLQACDAAGVRRIVTLSSSTVYGAHADNSVPIDEDAPCRPPRAFHYAWDKADSERLLQGYAKAHPGTAVSILRGCVVMGPSASNFITSSLFKPVLVGLRGYDPPMQFVHEDDVVALLWRFVAEPHPGVFNVAGPGTVQWSELARMSGKRLIWLPTTVAYPLTQLTWWLRLQNDSPAVGLDWIRYPWVVSTERLQRETGFRFQYTGEEALRSYLKAKG